MEFKKYIINCTHEDGSFKTYMLEGLCPQGVVKVIYEMLRSDFPFQDSSGWSFGVEEL